MNNQNDPGSQNNLNPLPTPAFGTPGFTPQPSSDTPTQTDFTPMAAASTFGNSPTPQSSPEPTLPSSISNPTPSGWPSAQPSASIADTNSTAPNPPWTPFPAASNPDLTHSISTPPPLPDTNQPSANFASPQTPSSAWPQAATTQMPNSQPQVDTTTSPWAPPQSSTPQEQPSLSPANPWSSPAKSDLTSTLDNNNTATPQFPPESSLPTPSPDPITPTQPDLTATPASSPEPVTNWPPSSQATTPLPTPSLSSTPPWSSPSTLQDSTSLSNNNSPTNPLPNSSPQLEPASTFIPSTDKPFTSGNGIAGANTSSMSAMDNPWGAPLQASSLNESQAPVQPSWMNNQPNSPTTSSQPAPTDLSHLISNNDAMISQTPVPPVPSTSTVNTTPQVPVLPNAGHSGIPHWLIGLGAGLLILVLGASAYFILGIGQSSKGTSSLPAILTSKLTNTQSSPTPAATPTTPAPSPSAVTQPSPQSSTTPAGFGQLAGDNEAPQEGTSAADLLRQRQQTR